MGAAFSSSDGGADHRRLEDLPESCVALILSRLEPPEICRLALVNRTFRRASSADCVWERKLPWNYEILVNKLCVHKDDQRILRKKDIYARLCCPNRLAGHHSMEVWMDKVGGGLCVAISWKGFKINGITDRRYWEVDIPTDESRFGAIAYLKQIWWLEVQGNLEMEFPAGTYSLYFRMQLGRSSKKLGRRVRIVDGVRGWDAKPLHFHLSSSTGHRSTAQYLLNEPPLASGRWMNYHVGDFVVDHNRNCSTKVEFSMTQIDCTHTKGGLCLDCVLVYPSNFPPAGHTCKCQDC